MRQQPPRPAPTPPLRASGRPGPRDREGGGAENRFPIPRQRTCGASRQLGSLSRACARRCLPTTLPSTATLVLEAGTWATPHPRHKVARAETCRSAWSWWGRGGSPAPERFLGRTPGTPTPQLTPGGRGPRVGEGALSCAVLETGTLPPPPPHPAVGREPGYHGQQWELSTACRPQRTALPSSCPSTLLVKDPGPWGPPKQ